MKQTLITGIRPSGTLTIANLIGSVFPLLELQKNTEVDISVFVATMHGLTDFEPSEITPFVKEVVRDYLALGLNPEQITIFDQRDIRKEVSLLKLYLERFVTVARITRVPTLKDKLRDNQKPEEATMMLAGYPILMAADILLQRASLVPVGKDQIPHIELTKEMVDSFNNTYGDVLVRPSVYNIEEPVNILALRGEGKMSKSRPETAIFLTDTKETIQDKMKRAETGDNGEITSHIINLYEIVKFFDKDRLQELDHLLGEHKKGEKVMALYKEIVTDVVTTFVVSFQEKRSSVSEELVTEILSKGAKKASETAALVLFEVENSMGIL